MNTEDVLFIALMACNSDVAWYCRLDNNIEVFACGLRFFRGAPVVKFISLDYWYYAANTGAQKLSDGSYTQHETENLAQLVGEWITHRPIFKRW